MTKLEARLIAKKKLLTLTVTEKAERSINVLNQITELKEFREANLVALYYPLKLEVDLLKLLDFNKTFCFPKINKENEIDFIYVDKNTLWLKNRFNINEPKNGKIVTSRIDLMLIPSLARNNNNNNNTRLGYGGGYYDKYLAKNDVNKKIGILLEDNIIDFNKEEFDIKMDFFITSKE